MIRGVDLFGREAISPNEKRMLEGANKTAKSLFNKRLSIDVKDQWGKDATDVTLEDIETIVIEAIKENNGDKRYGAKTIC